MSSLMWVYGATYYVYYCEELDEICLFDRIHKGKWFDVQLAIPRTIFVDNHNESEIKTYNYELIGEL